MPSPARAARPSAPPVAPRLRTPTLGPDSPVTALRGVGPAKAALLEKLGIHTITDALLYLPERHEDRSQLTPLRSLKPEMVTTVIGTVKEVRPAWNAWAPLSVIMTDATGGSLAAVWFRSPHLARVFQIGQRLIAHGTIQRFRGAGPLQMLVKDFEVLEGDGDPLHAGRLVPVYGLTAGITQRPFRAFMKKLVDRFGPLVEDPLPEGLRLKHKLVPLPAAIRAAHFPVDEADQAAGHRRLSYDDLLLISLGMAIRRSRNSRDPGISMDPPSDLARRPLESLPFELTGAQSKVFAEIRADMASPTPMSRLMHGEVGSGKTVVAALAMATAIASGFQAALLAPTSVLAEQHRLTLSRLLEPLGIHVALLASSVTGGERERVLAGLASGSISAVVGLARTRAWRGLLPRTGGGSCAPLKTYSRVPPLRNGRPSAKRTPAPERSLAKLPGPRAPTPTRRPRCPYQSPRTHRRPRRWH